MTAPPTRYDAVVVGSGPNGLVAAITLARAGRSVLLREATDTVGGGLRTEELTLGGHLHDVCSAVHPLAVASPVMRALDLERRGVQWLHAEVPLAHPLDDGSAVCLLRDPVATADALAADAAAYRRLLAPYLDRWERLVDGALAPPLRVGRATPTLARFGLVGAQPATLLARRRFRSEPARALFAGNAAHSVLPLGHPGSAAFGLLLILAAHRVGWPVPRGGSRVLATALQEALRDAGGVIETSAPVTSLADLPPSRCVLLDTSPRDAARIGHERVPARIARSLTGFRHGPGAFKLDWVLDGPIPWLAEPCRRATTVHLGGTLAEIAASEQSAWRSHHTDRPFVLLVQPSVVDPTRAPGNRHVAAAYCHVPNGSSHDMTGAVEAQIERFAPGFRDRVIARATLGPRALEDHNANLVGGDITGGANDLRQILARPRLRDPYRIGRGLYLCSASTPPGGGVHGMCGYWAAQAVLSDDP